MRTPQHEASEGAAGHGLARIPPKMRTGPAGTRGAAKHAVVQVRGEEVRSPLPSLSLIHLHGAGGQAASSGGAGRRVAVEVGEGEHSFRGGRRADKAAFHLGKRCAGSGSREQRFLSAPVAFWPSQGSTCGGRHRTAFPYPFPSRPPPPATRLRGTALASTWSPCRATPVSHRSGRSRRLLMICLCPWERMSRSFSQSPTSSICTSATKGGPVLVKMCQ